MLKQQAAIAKGKIAVTQEETEKIPYEKFHNFYYNVPK